MEGTRQQKIAKQIQKDISDIFQKDKWGLFKNKLISVSDVSVTPDLSIARIYLSMMMVKDKDEMIDRINSHKSEIRKLVGNRIGKQMRKVPELHFYKDELQERAARMDSIIDSLDIPPAEEDEDKNNE
ncbi:MAG: 30S ribosome-binding factor RbfA [Candidatus Cyclobacteriaceae bacterium M2_1C_046]